MRLVQSENRKRTHLTFTCRSLIVFVTVFCATFAVVAFRSRSGRFARRMFHQHAVRVSYDIGEESFWGNLGDWLYDPSRIHDVYRLDFSDSGGIYLKKLAEMARSVSRDDLQIANCEVVGLDCDWGSMAPVKLASLEVVSANSQLFNEDLAMYTSSALHPRLSYVSLTHLGDDYPRCGSLTRHARNEVLSLSGFRLGSDDVQEIVKCRHLQWLELHDCAISLSVLADLATSDTIWRLTLDNISGLTGDASRLVAANGRLRLLEIDSNLVSQRFLAQFEKEGDFNLVVLCRDHARFDDLHATMSSLAMKKYVELRVVASLHNRIGNGPRRSVLSGKQSD